MSRSIVRSTQQAYCLALVKVTKTGRRESVAFYGLIPVTWLVWILMQHQQALGRLLEKTIAAVDTMLALAQFISVLAQFIGVYTGLWLSIITIVTVSIVWAITPRTVRQ